MASKRKQNFAVSDSEIFKKKHTLDSDEEDSDDYERDNLNDSDIEGGEEGVGKVEDDVKITPFNMREELEEGHFDKEGHYHWNKEAEIKDNWLDNIDWVKVEKDKNYFDPNNDENSADSSLPAKPFNQSMALTKMLEYMKPGESVQMALQRLGRKRPKLSTLEKLRQKKAGIENNETQQIAKLTELANEILSNTGNMDIYQETYEKIKHKLEDLPSTSKPMGDSFDMYADDFEEKESKLLKDSQKEANEPSTNELKWEFKWKQTDDEIQGPYSTEKMFNWSQGDYFKTGVYVRKVGENSNFYSSNRIDFDLYL
ncbi:CD2 antigen cytoplasmic tail-binding protein 2 homolog [Drosophila hydei]|uniref:CD2 antigen cytoplasmic tail-binding protein 2 homolog n=1 Tax=Drosophila hydei TaxID=7224 RepID=A0A6J1L9A8_DROHY|nr:CD2 antigen cytoplasmic tail-binding protein 2 homolog [Drosophila hydei]